jgi:hypothetical protein
MLSHLERQANEILELAAKAETHTGPQHFASCRKFRVKLSEFEAFCNVIESRLRKLAGESRGELEDLFHKRRLKILRPSIRALTLMFQRLTEDGSLPLGVLGILDEELNALESVRDVIRTQQGELGPDDYALLDDIQKLEHLIHTMRENATDFTELTEVRLVAPIEVAYSPAPAPAGKAKELGSPHRPTLLKVRALLEPCRTDPDLGGYAASDLRALDEIEQRLTGRGDDRDALSWLRDICKRWASRLRQNNTEFMRLIDTLGPARSSL